MRECEYNKLIFICGNCEKKSKDCSEIKSFPYPSGWTYLHELKLKINGKKRKARDKHFCSVKCIKEFISKKLSESAVLTGGQNET